MVRYFLILLFGLLVHAGSGHGLELKPSEIRAKTDEKQVSVLQRRYFKKQWRPEVGILFGNVLNEAYTETEKRGIRLGLFATEWIGLEYQWVDTSVTASEDRKALDQQQFKPLNPGPDENPDGPVQPQPEVNKILGINDLSLVVAPFYGKLNLIDILIIYTDIYVALGVAQVETSQGDKTGLAMAFGQRVYMFKSLSFRLDFRNHSFVEKRGGKDTGRNLQSYDFGVSWFFL